MYSTYSANSDASRIDQNRDINKNNFNMRKVENSLIERSGIFEQNSRFLEQVSDDRRQNKDCKGKFGEITGEEFSVLEGEFGMPFRGAYTDKKHNTVMKSRNDFDLFDEGNNDNMKINYNDPVNSISSEYSSIHANSERIIPELYGTDPGSFVSVPANKFTVNIFNYLQEQLNDKFCISAYGTFNLFAVLYMASKGTSETEIYDYFNMVSRDNINEGLTYINNIYNKPVHYKQIIFKNILFINDELPINNDFVKYISNIIDVCPISVKMYEKETENINNYIYKISNGLIQPISRKVIEKAQILGVNIGIIRPNWKIPFEKTFDSKFIGSRSRIVRMLGQIDQYYEYYEDNLRQIIEIKCTNDTMSVGIILPKELTKPSVTIDEMNELIKNLKTTFVDEIRIPAFTEQIKMKLTNIFYQNGLQSVFYKLHVPDLVKSDTYISDIVQNVTFIIANSVNTIQNNKRAKNKNISVSNIKFIAEHPFIYYVRLLQTNTLLLIGQYF